MSNSGKRLNEFEIKSDSVSRNMEKINKNLDKIKNIFMPEGLNHPKSTKNSNNIMKASDLINTINSYTTFIKTGKNNTEIQSAQPLTKTQKGSSTNGTKRDKSVVDNKKVAYNNNNISLQKKSTDSFKKYLSSTLSNSNLHSGLQKN